MGIPPTFKVQINASLLSNQSSMERRIQNRVYIAGTQLPTAAQLPSNPRGDHNN